MKCGQRGLALCKKWEGCEKRLKDGRYIAYLDTLPRPALYSPGYNGLWTIGYGSTGPDVTEGTIWTQAQCDASLLRLMNGKAAELNAYLKVRLNQNQFDALCCAAYNLGVAGMHTVLDAINAGNFDLAMDRLVRHNHAGGVVVSGLTRRRLQERELFEWETPAEVTKISPPLQDANKVQTATAVGGFSIAGLWNYLPQVKDFMSDHNGLILLGVCGVLFGVTQLYKWRQHQAFNDGTYVPVGTKPVPEGVDDAEETDVNVG